MIVRFARVCVRVAGNNAAKEVWLMHLRRASGAALPGEHQMTVEHSVAIITVQFLDKMTRKFS
jgi:hypothetical protein